MAVTVNRVSTSSLFAYKDGEIWRLRLPLYVTMNIIKDGEAKVAVMRFDAGFACDGLSVPAMFRWFLKNWDNDNELYNIAGIVHDALYGNKGYAYFNRSECDDIFRGLLRISGKDRKHASMADWCVGVFAGSHWGDDRYYCRDHATLSISDDYLGR